MLRIDRLEHLNEYGNIRSNTEGRYQQAMGSLWRLRYVHCGLCFDESTEDKLALMSPGSCRKHRLPLGVLQFSCTPEVFKLIREEPHRFPVEHVGYAKPSRADRPESLASRDALAALGPRFNCRRPRQCLSCSRAGPPLAEDPRPAPK